MARLIGFRKMQGTSKKTGRPYDGYILYCTDTPNMNGLVGDVCFEKFVNTAILVGEPYLDASVEFKFDWTGYLYQCDIR